MRRKGMLIGLGAFIVCCVLYGYRVWSLNTAFPNPVNRPVEMYESVQFQGYSVKLQEWEWSDGRPIKKLLPDLVLALDSDGVNELPPEQVKVAYVTISFTKQDEDAEPYDVTDIIFESGAWANQWYFEVYEALNGTDQMMFDPPVGEEIRVTFPILFERNAFETNASMRAWWENVEQQEFFAVLSYYPEKIYLRYQDA